MKFLKYAEIRKKNLLKNLELNIIINEIKNTVESIHSRLKQAK